MGISFNDALLMWNARCSGASFENVCTLGRQSLCLHPAEVAFFRNACTAQRSGTVPLVNYKFGAYADDFFHGCLDARSISAIDYSTYQGADIVHDLNTPIGTEFANRFDAVIDGGTLEHIFNFPTAIANMMTMVRVGGRLFITTPANNLCGHGFYQFSPELMFRILSAGNGFEVIHLQLVEFSFPSVELTRSRRVYEVRDPVEVKSRVGIVNKYPVMMMIEARKLASVPLFLQPPLQSDYVTIWAGQHPPSPSATTLKAWLRKVAKAIFEMLPHALQLRARGYSEMKQCSLSNRRHFCRL